MDWNGRWQSIVYKINQYKLMCMNLVCCGHMSYIYGLFISFFFFSVPFICDSDIDWICCYFCFLFVFVAGFDLDSIRFKKFSSSFVLSVVCLCVSVRVLSGWCACAREIFVSKMSHWRWPNVLYFLYCLSPYTYL